jgi:trk system potassium uptake protein TrkH
MRITVVCHYLSLLLIVLSCFMLLPLVWSLVAREPSSAAFAISIAITAAAGLLTWRLTPVGEGRLNRREAILLVAGGWLLASFFGALPFVLDGTFPSYVDALFESVSGFTATGATVLTSIETQPQSILLWRSITQWLGGMGIITLFVALFPILGIGAAHLVEVEMPGPEAGRLTPRIRDTAKAMWLLYIGFTVLEIILLLVAGMGIFDAINVSLCTMATGGFTPTSLSIGAYNSALVEGIITFFMIAAAVNFGLYYLFLWKRQPGRLFKNPEFKLYISLLIGASLLVVLELAMHSKLPIGTALRQGVFQVTSIMTTTGFSSVDFNTWPAFSQSMLVVLMVIGGSAGSTAGAIKVIRLLVLCKVTFRQIRLTFNPQAVIPLRVGRAVLSEKIVSGIVGMSITYLAILALASLVMSAVGLDPVSAVSSVAATMGTVGPGLNLVGPAANYEFIPAAGKGVLMVCMLVGRLELFTFMILFTPSFWKWR